MSTASLLAEIDRRKAEIKHLQDAIEEHGAGRYVRALEARMHDYSRCIRKLAEAHLAKPLPVEPLPKLYFPSLNLTDEERAWLEGRADCPHFEGRETDLAAIRAEHWPEGA
jgi:hypothetical protein